MRTYLNSTAYFAAFAASWFVSTVMPAGLEARSDAFPDAGEPPYSCDEEWGECDTPESTINWEDYVYYQRVDDFDDDHLLDDEDDCPRTFNPSQTDVDSDGIGDSCDNCNQWNPDQADLDGDEIGDICDHDADGDGSRDDMGGSPASDSGLADAGGMVFDNCFLIFNYDQSDIDEDGEGDACDDDIDGDGLLNSEDPCPFGDESLLTEAECAGDSDMTDEGVESPDGISDFDLQASPIVELDNCRTVPNPDQADMDGDGVGDACDHDVDGDDVTNSRDNCPAVFNPNQEDYDRDRLGEVCDDRFCFVVPHLIDVLDGQDEKCLDPTAEFMVDTPNVLDATTGDEFLLRLFANRQNAGLQYYWSITEASESGVAIIINPRGATGYSTPYEYRYGIGREPAFLSRKKGTYKVHVQVKQVFEDAVTGEAGIVAEAYAVFEVRGKSLDYSSDCGCDEVGRRTMRLGSALIGSINLLIDSLLDN